MSLIGCLQLGQRLSIILSLIKDAEGMYADALSLNNLCLTLFGNLDLRITFAPIEILSIEKIKPLLWNLLRIVFSLENQTLDIVLLTILKIEALLLVSILADIGFS